MKQQYDCTAHKKSKGTLLWPMIAKSLVFSVCHFRSMMSLIKRMSSLKKAVWADGWIRWHRGPIVALDVIWLEEPAESCKITYWSCDPLTGYACNVPACTDAMDIVPGWQPSSNICTVYLELWWLHTTNTFQCLLPQYFTFFLQIHVEINSSSKNYLNVRFPISSTIMPAKNPSV